MPIETDGSRIFVSEFLSEDVSRTIERQYSALCALNAISYVLNPSMTVHQRDVALLSGRLARELDLENSIVSRIEMIAEVHDIGLNGVDVRIIDKAEPLSEYEFNILQLHPERGAAILTAIPALSDWAPIVRSHHERYDGRGYPDGLYAEEIPIESRVIAVADAFHAMTTTQPWRAIYSPFAAVQELLRDAETQFDPAIVEALIRSLSIRPFVNSRTA